jgi:putative tricarboxylic transport membrane protein
MVGLSPAQGYFQHGVLKMGILESLSAGFQVCLQPSNLLYCFLGCLLGTLVGVLPGIGPIGAMALLLPVTFYLPPVSAIIMYAAIYYGAMYGGSTTSILVNIPGEAASVITCLDGYQMARQGRAGPALGMAAFGSFIAGTLSIVGLMIFTAPLAEVALKFGPPEYFSLMCLGLFTLTLLSRGSKLKALLSGVIGLFLGTIGMDKISGDLRFTMGLINLVDGIPVICLAVGFFGVSEIFTNLEETMDHRDVFVKKVSSIFPTLQDWMAAKGAILRGSLIGFLLGILPGGGAILASFVSYVVEKKVSKYPEKFGTGIIEGVAGPEAANNSACAGSMIPLFALGIPPNPVIALLLSAFLIHGIRPGPLTIAQHPQLFWGTVASMYLGNIMLLVLNLPLIGMWVQILRVPYRLLFPMILLFAIVGTYAVNNEIGDVAIMVFFGVMGYLCRKLGYEGAPLIMSFVLSRLLEDSLRQSLMMSDGSLMIFIHRPISLVFISLVAILIILSTIPFMRKIGSVVDTLEKE